MIGSNRIQDIFVDQDGQDIHLDREMRAIMG
jgi:hypothetical protein